MIGPTTFATVFAWSIRDGLAWHVPGAAVALARVMLAASAGIVALATRPRPTG